MRVGEHAELWTHVAAPVMTRLRQPQRLVLDTLVDAGVARSRSDALAWCVRLVGQHEEDWLGELREAMDIGRRRTQQGPGGLTGHGRLREGLGSPESAVGPPRTARVHPAVCMLSGARGTQPDV